MSFKKCPRHNVNITDDDHFISRILDHVCKLEGLNKKNTVAKALSLLLSKHKNPNAKLKKLYKENLRNTQRKEFLKDLRAKTYELYAITNINSRLFDLCSKRSQTPSGIYNYLRNALKVMKYLDPKILKSQRVSWDKLKSLGVDQIKDYQNNILMLHERGHSIKDIKKISSDYQNFKQSIQNINDTVMVFKKQNG